MLSQTVLREGTDRRLLDEVIRTGRTTRAELAAVTGLAKPTVSEAVRRLVEGGLLDATGLQETGRRGRVGTFYEVGASAGWVLGVRLEQSGVRARSVDLAGRILGEHGQPPCTPGDTGALAAGLRAAVRAATDAVASGNGPLRAVAVSMANPVHPITQAVIALPGSPFPEGLVSPAETLSELVSAPVLVDNDVNLAALAEHRVGAAAGADSFAYVYVGAGLGLGLYIGDRLVRGAHGLTGEIGYLPGVDAPTLAGDLIASGFGRPFTDVAAVLRLLERAGPDRERVLTVLGATVARAVASVTAVVDPEIVLLGGPLGTHPALLAPVQAAVAAIAPNPVRLAHGTLGSGAVLDGAMLLGLEHARELAVQGLGAGGRASP